MAIARNLRPLSLRHRKQRLSDILQEQRHRCGINGFAVTVLSSLSGYALSRFQFRGKYWIIALMLITQMFPLVMLVAPIFKMLSPLGLTNSLTGLVIVYTAFNVPFATFLMQSFFDGIPKDLEEAARSTAQAALPPSARSSCL